MLKKFYIFNENKKNIEPIKTPHLSLLVGSLGCGKTNLILNMAKENDKFYNKVAFYSPNGKLDKTLRSSISDNVPFIENKAQLDEFLTDVKDTALESIKENEKLPKSLLIIDDSIVDSNIFPAGAQKTNLNQNLVSLRHVGLTSWISVHSWKQTPKILRQIARFIYVYPITKSQIKEIGEDTKLEGHIVEEMYNKYVNSKHDFITIDQVDRKIYAGTNNLVYSQFNK